MGINIKEQDRILIVAPHPDDEAIGCGGMLAMYSRQCDLLLITDGERGGRADNIAQVRQEEFIKVATSIEVNQYSCLHIPQHQIKANKKKILQYNFAQYSHIFVPNRYDAHKDHTAVYKVIKSIAKRQNSKIKLYEYEVWSPLRNPNIYLNISDVFERKKELIECHKSQIAELDYVGMILGLNAYRGRSHGYPFAECYYCANEKRQENIRRFKRKLKSLLKRTCVAVTWFLKAGVAAVVAICILCGITFLYNYTGIHITNETGATDYKWEKNQLKTTMSEGFAWLKMDKDGFNNKDEDRKEKVDILLMGSSHMEALEVADVENTGCLLNKMLPDYYTYNIGMSGHTIYTCVKNMNAAMAEYEPDKYVVLETDRIDLSITDMQKVIDDTYRTIPSYDSGLLYMIQKFIPAAKLIYNRLDEWRAVDTKATETSEMGKVAASSGVSEENTEYYKILKQFLGKATEAVAENGSRLIVFYQPPTELNAQGEFISSTDVEKLALFEKACEEIGVIFVDMTKPFEQMYIEKNILAHGFTNTAVGVGHLNREGHRVIAEILAQTIKNEEVKDNDSQ